VRPILSSRQHAITVPAFAASETANPGAGPGFKTTWRKIRPAAGDSLIYSCPYLCNTARQRLLTRQLCAASVAPQRKRLAQVIPPERSQNLAAAGRHGANSARSIAFAALAEMATKTHAEINSFMLNRPLSIFGW
jgi:hypothetical protein